MTKPRSDRASSSLVWLKEKSERSIIRIDISTSITYLFTPFMFYSISDYSRKWWSFKSRIESKKRLIGDSMILMTLKPIESIVTVEYLNVH